MFMFTSCYIEHLLKEILWYSEQSKVEVWAEVLPVESKAEANNTYRDLDYSGCYKKLI